MAPKKKAPKQPKRVEIPPPPKTGWEEVIDVFVGRGLRPFSLWFAAIFLPACLSIVTLVDADNASRAYLALAAVCFWTVPFDQLSKILVAIGNVRECIADCAPYVPGLVPYLPGLTKVVLPHIHKLPPAIGGLAPYLKYLVPYPDFVARALPHMVPKMDIMLEYNMVEMLGPQFKYMDRRHLDKLEIILPDMMNDLEKLAPYFHIIAPHIVEISLRADKLFPVLDYLLPHAEELQGHIWWLIPFADVEGFEEFMPYLDRLAPFIDDFAPYGPQLLPYFVKMKKHLPVIIDNVETLLPRLGNAVDHMDPLVYWLSDMLPMANSLGILRSEFLLDMGMPLLRFLPSVPPEAQAKKPEQPAEDVREGLDPESLRRREARKQIRIPRSHVVDGTMFYVVDIGGRYAGEFRYSSLKLLHSRVKKLARSLGLGEVPPFPGKAVFGMSDYQQNERRLALEKFIQFVLAEPSIVQTPDFENFIRQHRRWEQDLPLLYSPLIGAISTASTSAAAVPSH